MTDDGMLRELIGRYYDRHEAGLVAGLPEEGRRHLRDRYIRDVLARPDLLARIRAEITDPDPEGDHHGC